MRAPTCPWSSPSPSSWLPALSTSAPIFLPEYFERLRTEAERWGKPTAAVPGALMAQSTGAGAIGGKDSMSGSFEDEAGELNVPPTLISFAVSVGKAARAVSPSSRA